MKKPRKASVRSRAPHKSVAPVLASPQAAFAIVLMNPANNQLAIGLRYDGGIQKGPGFTTTDRAAKQFWNAVQSYAKQSGLLPDLEKNHGAHVAGI